MTAFRSAVRFSPGTTARILYVNAYAETSERTIHVIRTYTGHNGVTYIRAYCHLRREERTFRTDRILAVLRRQERNAPRGGASNAGAAAAPYAAHPAREAAASTAERPAAATRQSTGARRSRARVFWLLAVTVVAVAGAWLLSEGRSSDGYVVTRHFQTRAVSTAVVQEPREVVAPAPPAPDAVWDGEYRGQRFRVERSAGAATYTVLASGKTFASAHEMRIAVNTTLFRKNTGITDPEVIAMYAGVDRDANGEVSWEEVRSFQWWLERSFRYEPNSRALRPDEFVRAGGGDCEDWSLMTAGMLRFWGIPVYVGSLTSREGRHAIALVATEHIPRWGHAIDISGGGALRGGRYVPIDYASVGSLSGAVSGSYTFNWIRTPEELYGLPI